MSSIVRPAPAPLRPAAPRATRKDVRERVGWIALAVALGAFLALVVPQLGRPLMYDDANFAFAAQAVAQHGVPFGNQGWMSDLGSFAEREQWGVWHPPLYVYALGLDARLFGATPTALRLLGVLGGLATGLLTFLLAGDLTDGSAGERRLAGGTAALLALASPLSIQSALVLDIDFTLLLPLSLAFLLLYLRLESTPRWVVLVPLFAVLLWAKMTNPLALIGAVAAWQVLRGRFARALEHALGIGLGGVALFLATWAVVARVLGLPFEMPFQVNLAQWRDSADVAHRAYTGVDAFLAGLAPSALWIGPGLVLLGLLAAAVRASDLARGWHVEPSDLLLGLAAALVLGYVNKSAGWFPKYQVALVPLLAAVATRQLVRAGPTRRSVVVAALSGGGAFAVVAMLVRDDWALSRAWSLEPAPLVLLAAVVALAAGVGAGPRQARAALPLALVGVTLGWSLAVDAVQVAAPYSTTYWYGTRGTREAAAWVDAHLGPDDTYVASKEVAFASSAQRYVDQDTLVFFLDNGRDLAREWQGQPVRAIVALVRDRVVEDLLARELPSRGYRFGERIGDYAVYSPEP